MKKQILISLSFIVGLSSLNASADSYYGMGFSSYEVEARLDEVVRGLKGSNDIKGLEGYVGFEQSPYAAWEVRLGFGLGGDNMALHLNGQSIESDLEYKVDTYFSGYFRPQYKTKYLQLYGLLGYSSVSGKMSFDGASEDTSDDGFSYGFGAGVIFSEVNVINIEWKTLAKIEGGEITGLSFNFQRRY